MTPRDLVEWALAIAFAVVVALVVVGCTVMAACWLRDLVSELGRSRNA